jgi:hypothetical protein
MKQPHHIKPPCPRCPYTLGHVRTLVNPCPECKETGYSMYERFKERTSYQFQSGNPKNRKGE